MLEEKKSLNWCCYLTKNNSVVLKDSKIVLGEWRIEGCSKYVIPLQISHLHDFLDVGVKVSAYMPNEYNHSFDLDWVEKQHILAKKSGYPLFTKGDSTKLEMSDLSVEGYEDGRMYLASRSKYAQYIHFKKITSTINDQEFTVNNVYMDLKQKILLGRLTGVFKLEDLKAITNTEIEKVVVAKTDLQYEVEKTIDELNLLTKIGLKLCPLLSNMEKFCKIQKPKGDVSQEAFKYQTQLTNINKKIRKMEELLKDDNISVPDELLEKQKSISQIIEQLEEFDFDELTQKVKNHFKSEMMKIKIYSDWNSAIMNVLNADTFILANLEKAVTALKNELL